MIRADVYEQTIKQRANLSTRKKFRQTNKKRMKHDDYEDDDQSQTMDLIKQENDYLFEQNSIWNSNDYDLSSDGNQPQLTNSNSANAQSRKDKSLGLLCQR